MLTGLSAVLQSYSGDVSDSAGPIILLSGAILIMMLYHLINTVALVLEQQGTEWSSIVSRGGSIPQLVALQAITVGVLGLIGLVVGPLLSVGLHERHGAHRPAGDGARRAPARLDQRAGGVDLLEHRRGGGGGRSS